jgi:C4-dicarboxylate-specific signal transduction histidine kinase
LGKTRTDKIRIENLEEILSILRHELGNPINSLKITLDVLRENYDLFDDEKKRTYLSRSSELLARQEKILESLKSYSKFNGKKQEHIQFPPFWKNFSAMVSNKLKDCNIRFINELETAPCLIQANHLALNKVMASILENAIEALESVNAPAIELKALRANGFVKILLKDNGLGIKKNDMPKIFIPLFTTKPGKMGMGLTISSKLSREMGGRLEIESLYGTGTEVRLCLKIIGDQEKTSHTHNQYVWGGK